MAACRVNVALRPVTRRPFLTYNTRMADFIMIAITVGFVAICVAYIGWCDRIIGNDDTEPVSK
jgi:hypothetical protein